MGADEAGSAEILKLRKRAERERTARLAAESQAENGLRALYQAQREADLMRAIATAANEATFVGSALRSCLARVCEYAGSPVGHAWICPEDTDVLTATGLWHLDRADRFEILRGTTEAMSLRRGEGLPGRVLETGRPAWISDVSTDRSFSRNMASSDLGVKAAFAMPALIGTTVAAVLEFFFIEAVPPDTRILALAADIGAQLGRVIERKRANTALARARDELDLRVRERTADIERVNEELRREIAERDAADAANRAKSEFLANMSHEIRTPMTAVLGYADLLMDQEISPAERLNCVQTIRRNGEHLLTVLNDLLDLSKIEAGKMTLETIACSPMQIVADVASLVRVRALEKQLSFSVEFATPIPETFESDPTRLRQILMNLAGNAIKFTERGAVRIVVRCDTSDSLHPKVSFSVVDEGIGMSTDQIDKLFQPFMQADSSTTRRFGGTGLGLVICKRLADMLGGNIDIASEVGRGSTFTLTIATRPLDGVAMLTGLQEAGIAPANEPTDAISLRSGCRVLLAEDGLDNQLLISTYLKKAGASVTIAENGRVAVEKALSARASSEPFDVILMDMQMPEVDGYAATARLRSEGYAGGIVALTAHAMATDRERCIRAGCDDYATKPINRQILLAMVARFAEGRAGSAPPRKQSHPPSLPPLFSDCAHEEDMQPLVVRFVGSLGDRMTTLREASAKGDSETLGRMAHQLRGAAAGYGFAPITASAGRLEDAITASQSPEEIAARVDELASLCKRARSHLNGSAA